MIKGGYKIVNFNGTALSGTLVSIPGIYSQIIDDYDKPIMVSGVSLNSVIMDDAYAGAQEKTAQDLSKFVELTVYGGIITVTEDDEVTFEVSKTTEEIVNELYILRMYTYTFTYESGVIGTRAVDVPAPANYTIEGYTPIISGIRSTFNSSAYWGYVESSTGQLKVYRASDIAITEGNGRIITYVLYKKGV